MQSSEQHSFASATNELESCVNAFLQTTELINILGSDLYSKSLGRILSTSLGIRDPQIEDKLMTIPSETSGAERALLFNLFSLLWSGKNNVLEVGPFFGGTSRAIALGMLYNKRYQRDSKLYTYDCFEYATAEYLCELLAPVLERGIISQERYDEIKRKEVLPSFLDVFHEIHQNESYYPLLSVNRGRLPDEANSIHNTPDLFSLSPTQRFDAVFVDGCKSWFATKYFMKACAPLTNQGSFVIFQDYGWYTCFWIPAFVEALSEHFQYICSVDSTYVFVLTKPLTAADIDACFPDTAESWNESKIDAIFNSQIDTAIARSDVYAIVHLTMQHAAALAYTGQKARAKKILSNLLEQEYVKAQRKNIENALVSPTYRQGTGPINL